jgi:UDP-GlcNAc:undecaprenyl-phosphate GlcNAc-1-phosphate transferase
MPGQPAQLSLWPLLIVLAVGAGAAYLATPLVVRLAWRLGAIDYPKDRGVHTQPMPRWGGLAVYLGFLIALAAGLAIRREPVDPKLLGILIGATIVVAVGALDDRFGLPARIKLFAQVAAAIVIILFGVRIEFISRPLAGGLVYLPPWLGWLFTILWVAGVTNAVNLIDGLDGLAAGVSAIASLAVCGLAIIHPQPLPALIAAALAGAALGFLRHNFHPAKVFMGDSGAYGLGFVIASVAVLGAFKVAASLAIFVPLLVLAVPLIEITFSVARRARNGKPIHVADRDHLYHRMLARGLSQRAVVLIIYGISAVFCGLAFWITEMH